MSSICKLPTIDSRKKYKIFSIAYIKFIYNGYTMIFKIYMCNLIHDIYWHDYNILTTTNINDYIEKYPTKSKRKYHILYNLLFNRASFIKILRH